ncbi:tetratricopeptide repeat protein [Achromobacter seleniivolatilans]|uniref:Tetratricopeptide repeat protein n=1 Tax=Achromobacter seleniivolatilans TaxID=3047478 RepID=A0ABY9M8S7_9BURK|nr:tetratricopeptide repeat protein [Achromobacter sp. R39]WMD22984.1 tetratricopeptide repeat protein [Achromobacter sp. R39]
MIALLCAWSWPAASQAHDEAERLYDLIEQHDAKAFDLLLALAKDDDPQALAVLGFIYEHGVSVPRNAGQAIHYYAQACAQGGNYGCRNAAYFYEYGIGVAQDVGQARWYAQQTNTDGIDDLDELESLSRRIYDRKARAETDIGMRVRLIDFARSILSGLYDSEKAAMFRIGFGKRETLRLARVWAQDGDPVLNFMVGSFYNFGYSYVDNKNSEAFKWFSRAAAAGEPRSQNLLGLTYAEGLWGIQADPQLALQWYERAAQQGDQDALVNLGRIFYLGEIVPVDYERAISLFKQAAAKDSPRAARFLSWMYYNGQSVKTDCRKALQYRQIRRGERQDESSDATFWTTCKGDSYRRKNADQTLPVVTLQHKSTFSGGNDGGLACEPHFIASTNKLGEIANLRITVELRNDRGAATQRILAFSPFGLNTMDEDMNGREYNSFTSSTLVQMQTKEFCDFGPNYKILAATAAIHGHNVDLLAEGILKQ